MILKRKILLKVLFFSFFISFSQTDFSSRWEDFFSYNLVKDFTIQGNTIYALSENAVFTYDLSTQELNKISTVNGLSGGNTSVIYFNSDLNRLVIGYEDGLIEVVESDGSIRVSKDIVNFNQSGQKSINHISASGNILYLSLSFGIVEYNISRLEFGDTFFIGDNSQALVVNETLIDNGFIYAATDDGLYRANLSDSNLIDFRNWTQLSTLPISQIEGFSNQIFLSNNRTLYNLNTDTGTLTQVRTFPSAIILLDSNQTNLLVSERRKLNLLDSNLVTVGTIDNTTEFDFTINKASSINGEIYLATNRFGILQTSLSNPSSIIEIHPEGPLRNDIFSLSAKENNLWVVYGGYTNTYAPLNTNIGYTHYDGSNWNNTNFDASNPLPDLVDVTFDPDNLNRVYISSFGDTRNLTTRDTGGLLVIENNEEIEFYNHLNSDLEDIEPNDPARVTIRLSGSAFDNQGNLWIANVGVPNQLKKFSNGNWSSFGFGAITTGFGMTEITVDRANNIWVGTRSGGAIVFNENGERVRALTTSATQGSLPNANVRTIAVDDNNRIWIGTNSGLVVFNNANNVFNLSNVDADPIIILEDDVPRRLLGDQSINSIVVDGANNKWFGTDNGGVIYTNPNGQNTLATFNTDNSPLPSNKIVKIAVDESSGKVFFATNRGLVAYDSNVAPFGNELGDVYAYPNPATRIHQTVTIDGRNGTNLPRGTNVKILDVAGNLVFETNVVEGQQLNGGRVVWDKRNLAGRLVASGIYIVLLSNEDASETSTTKIAIIN